MPFIPLIAFFLTLCVLCLIFLYCFFTAKSKSIKTKTKEITQLSSYSLNQESEAAEERRARALRRQRQSSQSPSTSQSDQSCNSFSSSSNSNSLDRFHHDSVVHLVNADTDSEVNITDTDMNARQGLESPRGQSISLRRSHATDSISSYSVSAKSPTAKRVVRNRLSPAVDEKQTEAKRRRYLADSVEGHGDWAVREVRVTGRLTRSVAFHVVSVQSPSFHLSSA